MRDAELPTTSRTPTSGDDTPARLLTRLEEGNREVLHELIGNEDDYQLVDTDTDIESAAFDCAILGVSGLFDHRDELVRRSAADQTVLPFLLVVQASVADSVRAAIRENHETLWEHVDGVLEMPITAARLNERIRTVLRIRWQSIDRVTQQPGLREFKRASEAAGQAIYITDRDGTIQYVNAAFESLTGYSASEAIGETPRILNSGTMGDDYFQELWATITAGEMWEEEIRNRRADGTTYDAYQTIAPIEVDGSVTSFVAIQRDITLKKRRIRALKRERDRIQALTDAIPALIIVYDETGRAVEIFTERPDMLGASRDDILGSTPADVLSESAGEELLSSFETALETGAVQRLEYPVEIDGSKRWFDGRIATYPDEDGDKIVLVASDVTAKRKRLTKIRRLSEYRRVMSEVNQYLVRADDEATMLSEATKIIAASDLFECTFLTLEAESIPNIVCESESELTEAEVDEFHTEAYFETVYENRTLDIGDVTEPPFDQHSDDSPSHSGLAVAISHAGVDYGVLTIHFPPGHDPVDEERDLFSELAADLGLVVHKKKIESDLRTFTEIADNVDDPLMLQDLDGNFELVNDVLADLAEMPKDDLRGRDESAFMDEEAATKIQEMKNEVVESGSAVQYEISPSVPGASERHYSTYRYPHYDSTGDIDGTIAICRDVTDLKEREQQLKVIDRVLRHNVSNSMTVVTGYAETIQERTTSSDISEYATRIRENGLDLVNTVRKEREISKFLSEPPPTATIDLGRLVETTVEDLRSRHESSTLSTSLEGSPSITTTEALGTAIEELMSNAISHSDRSVPTVTVSLDATETMVTIEIADDGPGIPEMEQAVLTGDAEIEPLYHGSGLGLWLVNLIVGQADGELSFAANDPRGSIVRIELPR